jgi:hypothetical protein
MAPTVADSTPLNPPMAAFQPLRHNIVGAAVLKHEHGKDMSGYWIGPFRPQDFISKLMVLQSDLNAMPDGVKFAAPKGHLEKDIYTSFVCLYLSVVYPLQN